MGGRCGEGATVTLGCIDELYLQMTPNFGAFLARFASGMNFAEAGAVSQPVLSRQTILIGDPLYRPFAARTFCAIQVHRGKGARSAAAVDLSPAVNFFMQNGGDPGRSRRIWSRSLAATNAVLAGKIAHLYAAKRASSRPSLGAEIPRSGRRPQERGPTDAGGGGMAADDGQDCGRRRNLRQFAKEFPIYPDLLAVRRQQLEYARDLDQAAEVEFSRRRCSAFRSGGEARRSLASHHGSWHPATSRSSVLPSVDPLMGSDRPAARGVWSSLNGSALPGCHRRILHPGGQPAARTTGPPLRSAPDPAAHEVGNLAADVSGRLPADGSAGSRSIIMSPDALGPREDRSRELLVAASPSDEIADTHWYRPTSIIGSSGRPWILGWIFGRHGPAGSDAGIGGDTTDRGSRRTPVEFRARWVIDASGPWGFGAGRWRCPNPRGRPIRIPVRSTPISRVWLDGEDLHLGATAPVSSPTMRPCTMCSTGLDLGAAVQQRAH